MPPVLRGIDLHTANASFERLFLLTIVESFKRQQNFSVFPNFIKNYSLDGTGRLSSQLLEVCHIPNIFFSIKSKHC